MSNIKLPDCEGCAHNAVCKHIEPELEQVKYVENSYSDASTWIYEASCPEFSSTPKIKKPTPRGIKTPAEPPG